MVSYVGSAAHAFLALLRPFRAESIPPRPSALLPRDLRPTGIPGINWPEHTPSLFRKAKLRVNSQHHNLA
jgi:hypothetical protein